jgi:hypothetical protein
VLRFLLPYCISHTFAKRKTAITWSCSPIIVVRTFESIMSKISYRPFSVDSVSVSDPLAPQDVGPGIPDPASNYTDAIAVMGDAADQDQVGDGAGTEEGVQIGPET